MYIKTHLENNVYLRSSVSNLFVVTESDIDSPFLTLKVRLKYWSSKPNCGKIDGEVKTLSILNTTRNWLYSGYTRSVNQCY